MTVKGDTRTAAESTTQDDAATGADLLVFAGMTLDLPGRTLLAGDEREIPLTRAEFELLSVLIRSRGRALSRDQCLDAVASRRAEPFDRTVDVLISRLRRKIEPEPKAPRLLLTVPGHGYKFADKPVRIATGKPREPLLASAVQTPSAARTTPAAERRLLTVMMCSLSFGAESPSELDPEQRHGISRAFRTCRDSVSDRHGGVPGPVMGDTAHIYFGFPMAREHDAECAVRAGLDLVRAMRVVDVGLPLHARVGIATGLVVVDDVLGQGSAQEPLVVGETPDLAAGLHALARPGAVVIDAATQRLAGGLFEYADLEPAFVAAVCVTHASTTVSRFEALRAVSTPLVGREEDIELLRRRWRQAGRGELQVVLIAGEAGIGKSRLTTALFDELATTPHTRLRFFCSPHHTDSALHPIIAQLEHEAGFAPDEAPLAKLEKLDALLASVATLQADRLILAELLSLAGVDKRYPVLDLPPQIRKERTLAALLRWLEASPRHDPVLMVFEDIHWIDPTSLQLLDRIIDRLRALPALLLVTLRPEFTASWAGQPHVTTLALRRLGMRDSATLAGHVSGNRRLGPKLLDEIVSRADGVPLFLEELTKAVVEAERSVGEDIVDAVPAIAIPTTLQASLIARLDRIPDAKELAQIGAVLGREFSHALLAAISDRPAAAVENASEQLVASGLAARHGALPEATYIFKHALVRDTAYDMLSRSRRRALHAKAAEALEMLWPELQEQQPELLAHHYTAAGRAEPAIAYWAKAAHRAIARSAMLEAAAQFRQALALVPNLPEGQERLRQELQLQGTYGGVLFELYSWADGLAAKAYSRALELAEQLEDVTAMTPVLSGLVTYYVGQCQFGTATNVAVRLLGAAERGADAARQMVAHRSMAVCLHWSGNAAGAVVHFDRVLALYDPDRDRHLATLLGFDARIQATLLSCFDLMVLGRLDQALERFELANSQLADTAHMHTRAFAYGYGGMFNLFRQEWQLASDQLNQSLALATRHHFVAWEGISSMVLGAMFVAPADGANGLAQALAGYNKYTLRTGLPQTHGGVALNSTYYRALLAQASEAAGNLSDALGHLETGITVAEQTGECWFEPELHRLKGELLLRQCPDAYDLAEVAFRFAIERAVQRGALLWELRASTSLAKLLVTRGRPGQAYRALAPVHHRFTEGLDWPDLREATLLLSRIGH